MNHKTRWTLQKIQKRLEEISPLVYRRFVQIPPFHFLKLDKPDSKIQVGRFMDDSEWELISENSYWGFPRTNFILRSTFCIPENWEKNHDSL